MRPVLPEVQPGRRVHRLQVLVVVESRVMLLRLVLVVSIAALVLGVAIVVAVSQRDGRARERDRARLALSEDQLRLAQTALRRIANHTAPDPGVEASLTLDEMDSLETREITR